MDDNIEDKLPEFRMSGTRQAGGIVPGGSEVSPKSSEGLIRGLIASPSMDKTIAEQQEEDFVVASRLGAGKRSPRGDNPRVVAVVRLDKEVRIIPGPPPLLKEKNLDSSKYTEPPPELDPERLEEIAAAQKLRCGEEPMETIEIEDDVMEADGEESATEGIAEASKKNSADKVENKSKKKSVRPARPVQNRALTRRWHRHKRYV